MDPLANNTNPQWWKDSGMRRLNFLLLACYIGAMANGYISSLISNLIANPRYFQDIQGLSHPKLLGLVTAAQSMGCIAAFFPAPWLSDNFYLAPVLRTVGITNSLHQQGINGGLQIYVWLLACGAALLCEKAGRRRLFLTSTGLMLVFMVLITICSALYSATGSTSAGYAVIVFLFLFFGGYVIGLTPIPILYVNEIWPSHLRTKGTSVFWVSQAVSITFNQFVNPVAIDKIAWKYYLVYIGVLVVVINFIFFYVPETKGLSLEQISSIFDPVQEVAIELPDVSREARA
ncbi:unnamed protein product [Alternaria alternata]